MKRNIDVLLYICVLGLMVYIILTPEYSLLEDRLIFGYVLLFSVGVIVSTALQETTAWIAVIKFIAAAAMFAVVFFKLIGFVVQMKKSLSNQALFTDLRIAYLMEVLFCKKLLIKRKIYI